MALVVLTLLLASVGWAEALNVNTSCFYPFEPVGDACYFFSEEHRNYQGAVSYCNSLSQADAHVTMAMLGYDSDTDNALLEAMMIKNQTFLVGGHTEDGVNWNWQDGRDVDIDAPYWYYTEPSAQGSSCMASQGYSYDTVIIDALRSALYSYDCDQSINFVCQMGCPFDFVHIDNRCYFLSEELGLEHVTWPEARDYCQSIEVPDGYHVDLAVLGLPKEDTYHLINSLATGYSHTSNSYIGGYQQSECNYVWIDDRSIPHSSMYWEVDEPDCGTDDYVSLLYFETFNRTYIEAIAEASVRSFICQMFMN